MDFLNSYGVRLLMPFSGRWFYGDALYIVDPWLYLALGMGWWLASRREKRGAADAAKPARIGVVLALVYMAVMFGSNMLARAEVRDGLVRAGLPATTRFMVTPVVANPFKREVVIDAGGRYEKGLLWFEPLPHFRPSGFGIDTASRRSRGAARAADAARARVPRLVALSVCGRRAVRHLAQRLPLRQRRPRRLVGGEGRVEDPDTMSACA